MQTKRVDLENGGSRPYHELLLQQELEEGFYGWIAALANFFQRPWWHRSWIRQEAVVPYDANLHLGSSTPLYWDAVASSYNALLQQFFAFECAFPDRGIEVPAKLWNVVAAATKI